MNSKFFNIDELYEDLSAEPEEKSGFLAEKFLDLHFERTTSIKHLTKRLPGPGEIFFLWTIKSFNAFTFIPYIIKQCGKIDELIVSTYSINKRIIEALIRLVDRGKIGSVHICISDSIRTLRTDVYDHLSALVEKRSSVITITYSWNHSKIALIRSGDHYFDVEGSGNWGENARHEQYIFLNSRDVFTFRKNEILYGSDTGTTKND